MLLRSFAILAIINFGLAGYPALAADNASKQPEGTAQQSAPAPSGEAGSPTATAESATKGELKNPYSDFAKVADEGHKKFMAAGCNGCHGGGGGGGMGPPLTNEVWVYGKDDDTVFRLIALGSDGLKKQGYNRKGSENVVGPMPAMGGVVKSDDDLWKIIAWIRSVNPSSASAAADTARRVQGGVGFGRLRFLLSVLGCCRGFGYCGVRAYSCLTRPRRIALQTRFAQRPDSLVANLTGIV